MTGVSRRRFLAAAGALAAGGAAGSIAHERDGVDRVARAAPLAGPTTPAGVPTQRTPAAPVADPRAPAPPAAGWTVPFHGRHQAGVETPQQRQLAFASFDAGSIDRTRLVQLLQRWTAAAAALCAGSYGGPGPRDEPPVDSGEAAGCGPSRLTLTVGLGATLFERDGVDRFGLAARRPARLVELPPFRTDQLLAERCGGDLAVQACADDPLVTSHAIRTLRRIAGDALSLRWLQTGFLGGPGGATPRNLFGFKDGTANPAPDDRAALDHAVWVGDDDVPWLRDGCYLVVRRIHMRVEKWDESALADQEATIGRRKDTGAPLGGRRERDPIDLHARRPDGTPVLPTTAHVRLAAPENNGGARLLRRSYTFVDNDDGAGEFDAGLFFLAYQRDPVRQFLPIQSRLARGDAMNEYVVHTGSAVFACPPGVQQGGWWGESLFG